MKRYLAELLESGLHLLCALTNHAHGCTILNRSPLRAVYWWAVNARWDDQTDRTHNECPTCRFDRTQYVTREQYETDIGKWEREYEISEALRIAGADPAPYHDTYTTAGTSEMWRWDAASGQARRIA